MQFRFNGFPEDETFDPAGEGWTPLKEPNLFVMQLMALPLGVLLAFLIMVAASVTGVSDILVIDLRFLLVGLLIVIVHEWLHALMFPVPLASDRLTVGFYPKAGMFYAHYDGEMSRNRFVAVLLTPFIVLSVGTVAVLALAGVQSSFGAAVAVLNALFSCADVLGVLYLLVQVPAHARVRNKGYRTFWRTDDER